jgi:ADP-heptose:LPS heptosyltransferase/SAM-dependent methyltransferase
MLPSPIHESELQSAQRQILEQELGLRKTVVTHIEQVISRFNVVRLSIRKASVPVSHCADQVREISKRLSRMREEEAAAIKPTAVPIGGGFCRNDDPNLLRNARLANANRAYFGVVNIHRILSTNIDRLFTLLLKSDPSLGSMLDPALRAIQLTRATVDALSPDLSTRPVRRPVPVISEAAQKEVRGIWSEFLRTNPSNAYLQSLVPHQGRQEKIRLVYFSFGGLGDAILQGPCLAELKRRFAPCEILLIHSRPSVSEVFAGNQSVDAAVFAPEKLLMQMIDAFKYLGIFDLVIESRFVVWAELCQHSRLSDKKDLQWIARTQEVAEIFAPYVERFPLYGNLFARIVKPMMLLDVHGMSTGLPVSVDSPLPIFPALSDIDYVEELGLHEAPYVTIHDGFDEAFGKAMRIARCTKQLPLDKWREIIGELHEERLKVVQVGGSAEPLLPGVDVDLRGKTSISQLCFVLKSAVAHIDTEGGIVHVARAVNKRSIVFFGPTSVTFWGYPTNINLCSDEYTDCWWINRDWMAVSPVQQDQSAMEAFDIKGIGIRSLVVQEKLENQRRQYLLNEALLFHPDPSSTSSGADEQLEWAGKQALEWIRRDMDLPPAKRLAILGKCGDDVLRALAGPDARIDVFPLGQNQANSTDADGLSDSQKIRVLYGVPWNLPANSGEYNAVLCIDAFRNIGPNREVLREVLRILAPNGTLALFETVAPAVNLNELEGSSRNLHPFLALLGSLCLVNCILPNEVLDQINAFGGFHVVRRDAVAPNKSLPSPICDQSAY